MAEIIVTIGGKIIEVELCESLICSKILDALPIRSKASRWGDEVYFSIPVEASSDENKKEILEIGDVCYWEAGRAIAIFFGPTPVSEGDECRAYEPVSVIGKVVKGIELLKSVKDGDEVKVELAR